MARKPNPVPTYRLHKQSGQAIVTLTDPSGKRRDVLLGRHGSQESKAEYRRVLASWEAGGGRPAVEGKQDGISVNELAVAFLAHAVEHYRRPDGTTTSEVNEFRATIRILSHLYGSLPVNEFSPLKLRAVRELMIDGYVHTTHGQQAPLCRTTINQRVNRVRRLFKWGVEREMVKPDVLHGLQAVAGLQGGRSAARETEPVEPVAEAHVSATLPYLLPVVADMVRVQLLTAMRAGEVCSMRAVDLDRSGPVWTYRPPTHKLAYRQKARVIALGPKAQLIIRQYLKPDLTAFLFSPREAMEARSAARKTPLSCGHRPKANNLRKLQWSDRYSVVSYGEAIAKGCKRADRALRLEAEKAGEDTEGKVYVPRWHSHQLRHTAATTVRRLFGLEHAQATLGHERADITQLYAAKNEALAVQVAAAIG